MHVRSVGDSKLILCVNVSMNGWDSWDRQQSPCDPELDKLLRKETDEVETCYNVASTFSCDRSDVRLVA